MDNFHHSLETASTMDDSQMTQTLALARQTEAQARAETDWNRLAVALCYQAQAYRVRHDSARAQDVLEDAADLTSNTLTPHARGELALQLGRLSEDGGQLEDACESYEAALQHFADEPVGQARCFIAWASALREQGDYGRSQMCLNEALSLVEPGTLHWVRIQDGLGQLHDARGQYEEAVAVFEEALDQLAHVSYPRDEAQVRAHLAAVELKQGLFHRAEQQAESAKALVDPAEPSAHRLLGEIALEKGAFQTSRTHLRTALKLFQRSGYEFGASTTARLLASTYIRLGDLDRAEEYLDEADDALRFMDDAVERGLLTLVKGDLAISRARFRDAEDLFTGALRHFSRSTLVVERGIANRHLAEAAFMRRKYKTALDRVDEAAGLVGGHGPEQSRISMLRGLILEAQGEFNQALTHMRRSAEADFESGWDWKFALGQMHMARVHRKKGEPSVAEEMFADVQTVWSQYGDRVSLGHLQVELADMATDTHRFDVAVDKYRSATETLRQSEDELTKASALRKLARAYRLSGLFDSAAHTLDEALNALKPLFDSRDPNSVIARELALARLERADLQFQQGDFSAACNESHASLALLDRDLDRSSRQRCIKLYAAALAALGRASECLTALLEVEGAQLMPHLMTMYDSVLVDRTLPLMRDGHFTGAVKDGFILIDESLKQRIPDDKAPTAAASSWFQEHSRGLGQFDKGELEGLRQLCIGALSVGRNRVMHRNVEMTPVEAQCWISVINLILHYMDAPGTQGRRIA